jgi:hypothetical protein
MKILIATGNPAKVATYAQIIRMAGFEPISFSDLDNFEKPRIVEDAPTREENSLRKSKAVAKVTRHITIATDEGFSVDKYTEEWNKIIAMEPRRLGTGVRCSDQGVIDWHNEKLESVGGYSLASFDLALSIVLPNGNGFVQNFVYPTVLLKREVNFPTIKEGYPLDSQSKDYRTGKFISELNNEEYSKCFPMHAMVEFLKESVKKFQE